MLTFSKRALASAALIAGGAALLAYTLDAALQPRPAPYEFKLAHAPTDAFPEVVGLNVEKKSLERLEILTPTAQKPIATGVILHDDAGRKAPLDWRNAVTEPVFFDDLAAGDVAKLAAAVRDHAEEGAVVLAWWDVSRALRKLARRDAPLDDPQARGLLLPVAWADDGKLIAERARTVWGAGVPEGEGENFSRYMDALAMDETAGAAALRRLAGGKTAYVVVHLADIWKLASARPETLSIAYRDFPNGGEAHGVMKAARAFIEQQKIDGGYMIEPVGSATRLHYLTKSGAADLLIAHLLPFSTSNPLRLGDFQLVFQQRGFWVYRLAPAKS